MHQFFNSVCTLCVPNELPNPYSELMQYATNIAIDLDTVCGMHKYMTKTAPSYQVIETNLKNRILDNMELFGDFILNNSMPQQHEVIYTTWLQDTIISAEVTLN